MKPKLKQTYYLIFFIIITNYSFLKAHDFFNGGCKNHCKESVNSSSIEKEISNINDKKEIEDNYSCLKKSLCRGW